MRMLLTATALGAALSLSASVAARAQPAPETETGAVRIEYANPINPEHRPIMERLKQRRVLEDLRDFLSPVKLPAPLTIKLEGCGGTVNAWYAAGTVSYCYELVDFIRKSAPREVTTEGVRREDAIAGTFIDIMLHEISHGLFDLLKIPVLGREEDAADQLAAFVLLQFGNTVARRTLTGTATFWGGMAANQTLQMHDFADVHGVPAQRFYNVLCIAYGAQKELFEDFVDKGLLPRERAGNCQQEYRQLVYAYLQLIAKHIDPVMQKKVQEHDWLKPDDGR
jgi:Putative metallopeptidase